MTEPATPPRRLRALLLNLVLLGVTAGVMLSVAEVAVRLIAPQQLIIARPDIWQPMDSVGWIFRPDLNTTVNTGEGTVHVVTDADGLRVGQQGRVEGTPRVLLMGDSFLAALQVEYEQSLPGLLQRDLPAQTGTPVAVRNAGVAGWDPPQYLARTRHLLARDSFGLAVVFLYVGNDVVPVRRDHIPPLEPAPKARWRFPSRISGQEFKDALFRPANDFLETHSHLFILAKTRLRGLLMRVGLTAEYFPDEFRRSEATAARWDVTAELCADIAAEAARHNVPLLFVLIPTPWQVETGVWRQYLASFQIDSAAVDLDQPNRLLTERLRARGILVHDPLDQLRARAAAGEKLYGSVDRHFTPAGHAALEAYVLPLMRERLREAQTRQQP